MNLLVKLGPADVGGEDHADQIDGIDPGETRHPELGGKAPALLVLVGAAVSEDETGEDEEETDPDVASRHNRLERSPKGGRTHEMVEGDVQCGEEADGGKRLDIRKPLDTGRVGWPASIRHLVQIHERKPLIGSWTLRATAAFGRERFKVLKYLW